MHEYSENENSKGNIEDNRKLKKPPSRKSSTDSVIYVGTIKSQDSNTVPVVDLTQSSECLTKKSKTLKTIYFPSRNFDRHISMREKLVTTSLVNLPVIKKSVVQRRLCSATVTNKIIHSKLALLNIPQQFSDLSDYNYSVENILAKAVLTKSDENIIDWIIDQDINTALDRSDSNDFSSFDTEFSSIQELCERYDVDSSSTFD